MVLLQLLLSFVGFGGLYWLDWLLWFELSGLLGLLWIVFCCWLVAGSVACGVRLIVCFAFSWLVSLLLVYVVVLVSVG